jgi:hypothetical protein
MALMLVLGRWCVGSTIMRLGSAAVTAPRLIICGDQCNAMHKEIVVAVLFVF